MPCQVTQIMCTHEIPPKVAKRFIPISGKWKSTNESRLALYWNLSPYRTEQKAEKFSRWVHNSYMSINYTVECHKMQKWETLLLRMYRNYPLFVGAWKSVFKLDLLRIQDIVKAWNVAILSPVCVLCGCKLKMTFCLNLPLVFMVGCGIILVRKSA